MSYIDSISTLQSSLATQAASRPVATPSHQAATSESTAKPHAAANAVADEASLSRTSVLLAQALTQPDVRVAKVAQIQQALAAGTYHVSSSDLAGKLIDTLAAA